MNKNTTAPAPNKKLRIFNKIRRDVIVEQEGSNKFCDLGSFYQYWNACERGPFENEFYVITRE